ncbi:MAG TPA: SCP2 sterol-binding domain-containing protein [Solirubrobacteraceae bacterium]|jgi:hypothetical protein|nr:SCP2 sterol-binding domain-containing protein [Solirubrobacteraceae bacterium]
MSEDARRLIANAVTGLLEQVPALKPLNLVVRIDLHGRGDTQQFRLALPEVEVTKDIAADSKVQVEMRREEFNRLTEHNQLKDWRQAFVTGRVKATGVDQYLKLIQQVVDKQEERSRLKKARH